MVNPRDIEQGRRGDSNSSSPYSIHRDPRSRKQYICNYENCNKSFTRSDHLKRHRLNHDSGKSTCPRCSVTFNRPDLLDRHLARHRQKDEEAGGYGLGVVETRKRMWRDAEGNIVTKRPALPKSIYAPPHQSDASILGREQSSFDARRNSDMSRVQEPLLTPRSMSTYSNSRSQEQISTQTSQSQKQWNVDLRTDIMNEGPDMCEFLTDSCWGESQQIQPLTNNPFDDMFNPDTASSFNMPFTTMNNYNWLFDENRLGPEIGLAFSIDQHHSRAYQPQSNSTFYGRIANVESNGNHPDVTMLQHGMNSSLTENGGSSEQLQLSQTHIGLERGTQRSHSFSTVTSTTTSSYERSGTRTSSTGIASDHRSPVSYSQSSMSEYDSLSQQPGNPKPMDLSSAIELPRTSRPIFHTKIPIIDEITRSRILDFIVQAGPKTPEGALITRDHHLLSLPALQEYCDLFFCRFNATYPLLHQATFEPSEAETLLIVSVLLLGATYGHKAGHRLAVCIHDVLRAQMFQSTAFQAKSELWVLQTILLVECFGKSRAGQTQHDMAHLFHGLLINLIRRSDCQVVCHPDYADVARDLRSKWRLFADIEQRKRLAFLCFVWDTQHAVLFSQSLCMSAFELRSSLPCNPKAWEAETPEDWYRSYEKEKEIWFLAVLKLYVNPGPSHSRPPLNDLSRLLILHGLMSISWDMKRREQTALGFVGATAQERQTRLAQSYDAWKADFDTHCMSMTLSLKDDATLKQDFTRFSTSTVAIYHAAHIILNVEILDLQIYAGAGHILGRPVTHGDYDRSRRILKQWIRPDESQAAGKAAWHAAHLLRDGIMNLDNWDVNDVFHYPWCLYIATLTCWAFHNDKDEDGHNDHAPRGAGQMEEAATNAQAEMSALISGMTSVAADGILRTMGNYPTSGLIAIIAKHLGTVRWAVVHEGMKILRGLVSKEM